MRLRLLLCCTSLLFAFGCSCDRPDPTMDGGVDDGGVPPDGFVPDGSRPPGTLFTPPTITECGDLTPASAGRCEVTAGDTTTLVQGDILTPGEVFRGGGVLIGADGRITCVGCNCVDMAGAATQVRCPDVVVSPGLINGHDHITFNNTVPYGADGLMTEERYEHRHDWRTNQRSPPHTSLSSGGGRSTTGEMRFNELRQLMSGTTSLFASGGPEGLLRNLDSDTRNGLGAEAQYETFPLGDSDETQFTDSCGYSYCRSCDTSSVAGRHAFVPHVAEGINEEARNEYRCMREGMRDFVQAPSAFIHGTGLLPADMAEMAMENVELIWSPRTNITLYGDTARVSEFAFAGVTIGLGTDWVRSGSMNMLRELDCADSFNTNNLGGFFPVDQLWQMATVNNAAAFNFEDQIGVLATGRLADLALYDATTNQDYRAVLTARPADVVLVMRGGEVLYGDADVVDALRTGCDPVTGPGFTDVCGSAKRACVQELMTNFSDLFAEANRREPAYPLFFCADPMGEPSCLPARTMTASPNASVNGSGYYTGMSSSSDQDGDGLADGEDNCPSIFNPIRPLDNGMQADSDGDMIGDACDGDGAVDATDRDGDGVLNEMDNCPSIANMDQSDRDMDMLGDVCDECPDTAIPAGAQNVYAIRCGATSGMVTLNDMVVTGVTTRGFFAQQSEGSSDYMGPDFSGIFVFMGSAPTNARGDVVTLMGMTNEFNSLTQLVSPMIMTTAMGMEATPLTVGTADVVTGGPRAEALESVLVRVETLTVSEADSGFSEFSVNDSLLIGDEMFTIVPPVTMGQMFDYIQGPLNYAFENTKVEPRDIADVGFGSLLISPSSVVTSPDAMVTITVVIPMDAPAGGADVVITPAPADILVGPAMITVPEGMRAASAMYTASTAEQMGMLTASFGGETAIATVSVSIAPVLFFSEYVEGTSNNKALEIFNAGAGTADLSVCEIRRYTNGSPTPSSTFTMSGMLVGGEVHVVCNTSIDMGAMCDESSGTVNHNGDDAYDLFCAGMVVDTFGQIGVDPGDEWMGGGLGTRDFVLTRQCSVTTGDTNGGDAFDPSTEWAGAAFTTPAASHAGLGNRMECP